MPTFDRRKQELKDRFTTAQGSFLFAETTRITAVLENYYRRRDDVLTDLAFAATEMGDDPKRERYESFLANGSQELSTMLNNMLEGVTEPTAEAMRFRDMATVEDARFFATLAPLRLGDVHDDLQLMSQNMEWETSVLRVKWSSISEADKALLDAERQAAVEMGTFIKEAIGQAVPARDSVGKGVVAVISAVDQVRRETKAFVAQAAEQAGGDADRVKLLLELVEKYVASQLKATMGTLGGQLFDAFVGWVRAYSAFIEHRYNAKVLEYTNKIPNHNAVIVTFTTTRQEAAKFLQENGMDVARRKFGDAKGALESWAAGLMTDGLRSDGTQFATYVAEGLAKRVDETYGFYGSLLTQFEGIFLGSLKSSIEEELLAPTAWRDTQDSILSLGLDEQLRLWQGGLQQVRLDIENAYRDLQANFAELPVSVQAAVKGKLEEIRADFLSKTDSGIAQVTTALEVTKEEASAEKVKQALDRRMLADALRR